MFHPTDERLAFRRKFPPRAVDIGGQRWEYFAVGKGPRALLILGGDLSFGDTSHRLITKFADSHRVISPSYPHVDSVTELVDGLVALVGVEGVEQVDVYGDGLGAGLAHLLARSYPGSVGRVALANFGLLTQFRALAVRARVEMMRFLPKLSVRQYYEHLFHRFATSAGDAGRSAEITEAAGDLLDRHAEETALNRLRLFADLFRGDDELGLARYVPLHALLILANDDPCFTRLEQDNLVRTYAMGSVVRSLHAGRLLGLTPAPELERKLELFLRVPDAPIQLLPARAAPAKPALAPAPAAVKRGLMDERHVDWIDN